jgi:hypothetical protein
MSWKIFADNRIGNEKRGLNEKNEIELGYSPNTEAVKKFITEELNLILTNVLLMSPPEQCSNRGPKCKLTFKL